MKNRMHYAIAQRILPGLAIQIDETGIYAG